MRIINMVLNLLTEFLLLGSAVLLYDALRRFEKTFSENLKFKENKLIMNLNFFVAVGHMFIEVVLIVIIDEFYIH